MHSREPILAPGIVTVDVQLQPALNVLNSHELLGMASLRTGLDSWVYETAAALSPEQHRMAKMLYYGSPGVITIERAHDWASFEAFLDAYEDMDAAAVILEEARTECEGRAEQDMDDGPSLDYLIANPDRYAALLMDDDDPTLTYDIALESHRFLTDPVGMHHAAAAHLREMWVRVLRPEWERRLPEVEASVAALLAFTAPATLVEAVRRITGRDVSGWMSKDYYASMEAVIFVPSPHMGPYITVYETSAPHVSRFSMGVRLHAPETAPAGAFEVQTRLEALADPVRLQIARMLAAQAEMSTEEIMAAFDLTKSSASRHLRLLTATGLISERREGGAKKVYSSNRDTAQALIRALQGMLLREG
jgi:DNA-binding transcriptional ArsR family regulator